MATRVIVTIENMVLTGTWISTKDGISTVELDAGGSIQIRDIQVTDLDVPVKKCTCESPADRTAAGYMDTFTTSEGCPVHDPNFEPDDEEPKFYRVAINYEMHGGDGFVNEYRGTVDEAIQFYGDTLECQFVDKEEHDNGNVDLNYERPWSDDKSRNQSVCVTLWPQDEEVLRPEGYDSPYETLGGE